MNLSEQLRNQGRSLSRELVQLCRAKGLTVATAESLTAGLCAATITDIPGASSVLRGGLVVYATELKHDLAGVSASLLKQVGAVDPGVAIELAAGAARRCGADLGLGLTGVAGPDPQDGHPVGDVFIGVSYRGEGGVYTMCASQRADSMDSESARQVIRLQAVNEALVAALRTIKS
ncbi:nicotinamide-nucleotide amidohydrolase family protein [Corynebacterium sp. 4HC-13]|uniref:CinA family protein n=1 Tax=Corynebacterium anserum TaxID=2684406 RepID=UPI00163B3B4E|nr:nicotinamide-nucleotide amidohydrolase family protein [Corynebacterium anserum]